jgi:uncharacterized protein YjbI with pentapeptide repeats
LPKCQFTREYYDIEIGKSVIFNCPEEPLSSGFCIFHEKDYLQDKTNNEEHKRKVLERLKDKVNHAISNNEPLFCIGFQLPDFSLSDLSISNELTDFTKPVYFSESQFYGKADFSKAGFIKGACFSEANFQGEAAFNVAYIEGACFSEANFQGEAAFNVANFVETNFHGANFQGEAGFNLAIFYGRAEFYEAKFRKIADFSTTNFQGEAAFNAANFQGFAAFNAAKFGGEAYFGGANFQKGAFFNNSEFYSKTYFSGHFAYASFNYVLFEGKEKVIFDIENLSNVSFMNTDITGVRFRDEARWGGKKVEYNKFWGGQKVKEDKFKIVDERLLEKEIKEEEDHTTKHFNLGSIKAVYRSLRENYEYRMRYDEAGQFFIREMELKRKYREVLSKEEENSPEIKQNNWFRRNFSLTGLYYNLFVYGEDLKRPALILLLPLFILSTLYWGAIDPSSSSINDGFARWFNATERTLFNMSQIEREHPQLVDTAIKTASLAILGTLLIPLRRKFERRFR